jgi:hypothetical protein
MIKIQTKIRHPFLYVCLMTDIKFLPSGSALHMTITATDRPTCLPANKCCSAAERAGDGQHGRTEFVITNPQFSVRALKQLHRVTQMIHSCFKHGACLSETQDTREIF